MFARTVRVERVSADGSVSLCPLAWLDNFAMRNFTNDALFDDTLPVGDGTLEIGNRVPVERLHRSVEDWFRRKGYLKAGESLRLRETGATA